MSAISAVASAAAAADDDDDAVAHSPPLSSPVRLRLAQCSRAADFEPDPADHEATLNGVKLECGLLVPGQCSNGASVVGGPATVAPPTEGSSSSLSGGPLSVAAHSERSEDFGEEENTYNSLYEPIEPMFIDHSLFFDEDWCTF